MSETETSPKFKIVHRAALVLLFLMMAQPTFDNINALRTGTMVAGDVTLEVSLSQMSLHIVATIVGWVGWWWFYNRQKRGAYTSLAAHGLGFTAVLTQTPEMLDMMPPAALVVFFFLLFAAALGPIFAFKEEYG